MDCPHCKQLLEETVPGGYICRNEHCPTPVTTPKRWNTDSPNSMKLVEALVIVTHILRRLNKEQSPDYMTGDILFTMCKAVKQMSESGFQFTPDAMQDIATGEAHMLQLAYCAVPGYMSLHHMLDLAVGAEKL